MMTVAEIMKVCAENAERHKREETEYAKRRFGYNESGYTFLLLEDLTDMTRRELFKSFGGFYDKFLGWHSRQSIDGFKMKRVKMEEIASFTNGRWFTNKFKVDTIRKECCEKKLGKRASSSKFIGTIGVSKGTIARVKLVSAKETAFRDAHYDTPFFYGLPFKWEYRFVDDGGNVISFSSAFYNPKMVVEWFGRGWADMEAKAMRHDDSFGIKVTKIAYPEFHKRGKGFLKDYARIPNPAKTNSDDSGADEDS